MNKRWPAWSIPVMIALLCLLTRLPQVLSPNLLLDGDECVLATMAKYLYHGKDFSVFFWGQNYGFSLVECAAIVPFYVVFGITAIAVKLAMLSLWTLAVIFFYKTLQAISQKSSVIPLLIILLLIASPAWAIWSMKARGGYLTAFLLSNILTWLLFRAQPLRRNITWLIAGVLIPFIYQSQPFFLAGVLPLVAYHFWQEKSLVKALLLLVPIAVISLGFHYYSAGMPEGYTPDYSLPDNMDLLHKRIDRVPDYFYSSLHGNYYFNEYQRPNFFCAFYAVLTSALIYLLAAIAIIKLLFKRRGTGLFLCAASALFLCAFYSVLPREMEGRYLLPLTGFALLALQVLLKDFGYRGGLGWSAGIASAVGLIALITFREFRFLPYDRIALRQLISYLENKGIHYTFSTRTMFPWQLSFYSGEKIYARTSFITGRFALHHNAVNAAYQHGLKTAVIGFKEDGARFGLNNEYPGDYFFVCTDIPDERLRALFTFPK